MQHSVENYSEEWSFDFSQVRQASEPQKLIDYIIEKYARQDFNLTIYKSSWPQKPTLLQTPFKLFGKDIILSLIENGIIVCVNSIYQINPFLNTVAKNHADNDKKLILSYQGDYITFEWREIYGSILLGEISNNQKQSSVAQVESHQVYTTENSSIQNFNSSQIIVNNHQMIYLSLASQHETEPTYNQEELRKLFVRLMATFLFKLMEISLNNNRIIDFNKLYLNSGLQNLSYGFSEDLKNKLLEVGVLITMPIHSTKNYVVNVKAISALKVHAFLKDLYFSIYHSQSMQKINIVFEFDDICQLANILTSQKPISASTMDPNDDYIPTLPSFS